MPHAYYNEIDPYAAQWLRNLIAAGHIASGDVDERSIRDVQPSDLIGYTQCHFFASIGVWSHALRRAGWDDARPVWTGSCPCQPFSAAGQKGGFADDRHLWPEFFRLIGAHRPVVVFGEQVASKDGLAWLDAVQADMEGADYAFGALDLCAAGFGAPHIRQRLFFVADSGGERVRAAGSGSASQTPRGVQGADGERERLRPDSRECSAPRELAYADGGDASAEGLQRGRQHGLEPQDSGAGGLADTAQQQRDGCGNGGAGRRGEPTDGCLVGHTDDAGPQGRSLPGAIEGRDGGSERAARQAGATNGFWLGAEWLPCIDGKARPVEPGTFPLAHGAPARVGRLRAYGNAIVAPVAEEFIRAYIETRTNR